MYSAESVINALKLNNELSCEGIDKVGCPSSHVGCASDPLNCNLCKNQKCSQTITIHKNLQKLIVINLRYMISLQNHGGFIRKEDAALKKLIDRNFIDKNNLKPA